MQISAASLLKVWLLFIHLLCNKANTAEEIHNKEFIQGTSQTVISHEKKTSVTILALVNLFWKFLVVQRPKTCLVNAWCLSRSQVAKDKVKKPHVHCEHSSCLHGSSVCVSPVYMICGLSWSGSPCDQGWKDLNCSQLFSLWLTESHYKPQCKRFKILLTAGKQREFL